MHVFVKRIEDVNKYLDEQGRLERCSTCPMYTNNYSCAPLSPPFSKLPKKRYYYMVMFIIFTEEVLPLISPKWKSIAFPAMDLMQMKLKKYANRARAFFTQDPTAIYLGNGACGNCTPCRKKKGLPCKGHPVYAMESVGFNVVKMVEEEANLQVHWHKKGHPFTLPYRIACNLYGSEYESDNLQSLLTEAINKEDWRYNEAIH